MDNTEYKLDKIDLKNLVKSVSPNYSVMEYPLIKKSGRYIGGFHDKWDWEYGFEKNLSENELWEIYQLCKTSWK